MHFTVIDNLHGGKVGTKLQADRRCKIRAVESQLS